MRAGKTLPPRNVEIFERAVRGDPPAWSTVQKSKLDQIRLVHFFDCVRLLVNRSRNRTQSHWPAPVLRGNRHHDFLIDLIQPVAVYLQKIERRLSHALDRKSTRL